MTTIKEFFLLISPFFLENGEVNEVGLDEICLTDQNFLVGGELGNIDCPKAINLWTNIFQLFNPQIKTYLDTIIRATGSKSWAPFKATLASALAKIQDPNWDTRLHKKNLGGIRSLRGFDNRFVCGPLFSRYEYYPSATTFALTRTFEQNEPFTLNYSANIKPPEAKKAFLNVVHIINVDKYNRFLLRSIVLYLLNYLKDFKNKKFFLNKSFKSTECSLENTFKLLKNLFDNLPSAGSSSIPEIGVHTVCETVLPYLWPTITTIKPLKIHTSPDNHSHSYGDIEGFSSKGKLLLVIEVKHKIDVDGIIISIFNKKLKGENVPLQYILTTRKTNRRYEKNISILSVINFIMEQLQSANLQTKDICSKFENVFFRKIMDDRRLSLIVQNKVDEIFEFYGNISR